MGVILCGFIAEKVVGSFPYASGGDPTARNPSIFPTQVGGDPFGSRPSFLKNVFPTLVGVILSILVDGDAFLIDEKRQPKSCHSTKIAVAVLSYRALNAFISALGFETTTRKC